MTDEERGEIVERESRESLQKAQQRTQACGTLLCLSVSSKKMTMHNPPKNVKTDVHLWCKFDTTQHELILSNILMNTIQHY